MSSGQPSVGGSGFEYAVRSLVERLGFDPEPQHAGLEFADPAEIASSYRRFIPGAWRTADPTPFIPNWHIDAKADHLQACASGQITRLIINEPPGYAKSLVTSVMWPAWTWINRPSARWICTSYGATLALRDARKSRSLIDSPWYQSNWGSNFSFTTDQNTKGYFENNRGGYRVSDGIDGGIPGLRCDFMVIDDPLKLTERLNIKALEHAIDAWNDVLRSRLSDQDITSPTSSVVVLIMQRLNADDMAGYFQSRMAEDGWVTLRLPAMYEADHKCRVFVGGELFFEDPRVADGEPLFPARVSGGVLASLRAEQGEWRFAAEQQQRPTPLSGGMIQLAWIHRYTQLPAVFDQVIQTWDCAFKKGELNSWVVGQVWGRRQAEAFLIDQVRGHWDLPETMNALINLTARHPLALAKYVEDKANGPAVMQMLKNVVPGLIAEDIIDGKRETGNSKEGRLAAIAPFFQAGNVFIPDDDIAPWAPEYVHELTTFPNSPHGWSDQVDATSMGVWKLLSTFQAHVPASIMTENLQPSQTAGMFENAYGTSELSGLAQNAYGRGGV